MNLYKDHGDGSCQPSVNDMTTCFLHIIETLDRAHLLGDAFDECTQWNALWKFLSRVAKSRSPSLHFLFTSRPSQHIQDASSSLVIPSLDLMCPDMDQDIAKFVSETLESDIRFTRIPEKGKVLIYKSIASRSKGMYGSMLIVLLFHILISFQVPMGFSPAQLS
jgi:hypothetical protein